ncbi:MAG: MFS transporter [Rubrivivax sp.]|nr:MFS transporter [Burkholderiales bacterium]MCW5633474.1 MFS transporter [Rubrivivax sp.]
MRRAGEGGRDLSGPASDAAAAAAVGDAANAADGLPLPRRVWAVVTLALGITLAVLDSSIANVALPTIAGGLGVSAAQSVWIVNAYQLTVAACLLPLALLGEIVGFRRVYLAGLALFVVGALACALSPSLPWLVAARVLLGLGGAGIMSVSTSLVSLTYPRAMLGRAVGINAMIVAGGTALGPGIAGAVLSVADWPWLFAIYLPIGLVALAVGRRALPGSPRASHRFDLGAALLNAATLCLFIVAIDGAGRGADAWVVGAELGLALLLGALLVRRELRSPHPLLPVDLLRIPAFGLSIAGSACAFAAHTMAYIALPFLFQGVMGKSPGEIGLLMTPWAAVIMLVAPLAGRLSDRHPAAVLGGLGMALLAAGLASLALLPAQAQAADIVWRMTLCGIGFGLFQTPNNRTMIASAPLRRRGGASGMQATARVCGQVLGAALTALVFHLLAARGALAALWLAAAFALLAGGASLLRLGRREAGVQ